MTSRNDRDWRLTVKFETPDHAHGVFSRLKRHASAALADSRLKKNVLVSEYDGDWLRLYGDSFDALCRGRAIIAEVIKLENVVGEESAEQRSGQEDWQPVELPPVPQGDQRRVRAHHGSRPWGSEAEPDRDQVRFELATRHDAVAFTSELEADGYDVHRSGSMVFLFADDTASAHRLGEELKERAPKDAQLFYTDEGRRMVFI